MDYYDEDKFLNYGEKPPRNHGKEWTSFLNNELKILFNKKVSIDDLALYFGRSKGAVLSRLEYLGLIEYNRFEKTFSPVFYSDEQLRLKNEIKNLTAKVKNDINRLNALESKLNTLNNKTENKNDNSKLLSIAVNDMLENGWYNNIEDAMESLRSRV